MVQGKLLRTNYRRTGGIPDIKAVGADWMHTSYYGSAGTADPGAGFLFFSYCGSFNGDLSTLQTSGPAGCSFAWVESTHAAMSAFYGENKFGDGYAFLPVGMIFYLYSDVNLKAGAGVEYMPIIHIKNVHQSDSLFVVSAYQKQTSSPSWSTTAVSQADFKAFVYGFIISAP